MSKVVSITESKALAELLIGIGPALVSYLHSNVIVAPSEDSDDVVLANNHRDLDSIIDRAKDHETWFYYCLFSLLFCATESLLPEQKMIGFGLVVASILLTALDFFNIFNIYDHINFIVAPAAPTASKSGKGVTVKMGKLSGIGHLDSWYWIPSVISLVLAILPISIGLLYDPGFATPTYHLILKSALGINIVTIFVYLLLKITSVIKVWVNVLTSIKETGVTPPSEVHQEKHEKHGIASTSNIVYLDGKSTITRMQTALDQVRIAWIELYLLAFVSCFLLNFFTVSENSKIVIKNGLIGLFGLCLYFKFHFFGSRVSKKIH